MKRILFTLLVTSMAVTLSGQRNSLDDFFNRYSDREGYNSVIINGNLFGLLKNFDDDPDFGNIDRKITMIRIVSRERNNSREDPDFLSELRSIIRRGNYEELMTVRNAEDDLLFLVRSDRNIIKEVLIVASGDDDAVIQIQGNLTRDDVDRISENHAEGLARLEELESSEK